MHYLINQISGYSILLPFAAAIIRFRQIHPVFYPFLLLIIAGTINELLSLWMIRNGYTNQITINIYCLAEALLVLWQFRKWKLFETAWVYFVLVGVFLVTWITDITLVSGPDNFCSYFILITSFFITLLSIRMINDIIIYETRNFLKNPAFIICVSFVIYFAYSFLVECFFINSDGKDVIFLTRVQQIFDASNLFTNLLYTLAVVWMPTRLRYTLQY